MKRSLSISAKYNALSSYLNFGVSSLIALFLTPLFVNYLGNYYFGIWKSIQKYLTFATVADGRATQALKWIIANSEGRDDVKEKQQAVGSSLKIWFYFFPLVLIIVGGIVWFLPDLIKDVKQESIPVIRYASIILGINIILTPLLGIPDSILVGVNQGYKSTLTKTIGLVITNLLMVLACYLGYGIIGLAVVTLFTMISNTFFVFMICKKNVAWLGIQKPTKEQVSQFFSFSFWVLIWSFIAKLILSTEIFLIGYFISPEEVSVYVVSTYIMQLAVSMALISGTAVTPGLGKLIGIQDYENARIAIKNLRQVILFFAVFFGGIILLLNKYFISIWMGEEYYFGDFANFLTVLILLQLVTFRNEGQIQDLTLNIRKKVLIGGVFSVVSIIFGALLFKFYEESIESLFIGILIGRIFLSFIFRKMVNDMVKLPSDLLDYIKSLVLLVITYFIARLDFIHIKNVFFLIFISALIVLFYGVICFYLLLSADNRKKIMKLLINI